MQIKKICFKTIKIGKNHAHSIGLFTRDNQSLCLDYCKITKPEFETLCVALGDENVMFIYIGFSKCFMFLVLFVLFNKIKLINFLGAVEVVMALNRKVISSMVRLCFVIMFLALYGTFSCFVVFGKHYKLL